MLRCALPQITSTLPAVGAVQLPMTIGIRNFTSRLAPTHMPPLDARLPLPLPEPSNDQYLVNFNLPPSIIHSPVATTRRCAHTTIPALLDSRGPWGESPPLPLFDLRLTSTLLAELCLQSIDFNHPPLNKPHHSPLRKVVFFFLTWPFCPLPGNLAAWMAT